MTALKETIPRESDLDQKLETVLHSGLTDFLRSTQARRDEVLGNIKFFIVGLLFFIAVAVFLFMVEVRLDTWPGRFVTISAMVWMLVLLLSGRSWFKNAQLLAREMNMALVPIFSNVLDRPVMYTHNDDESASVQAALQRSQLLTSQSIAVTGDDTYHVYGDQTVTFHELTVELQGMQRGKKSHSTEIFRGVLVVAELPRPVRAPTFVSTEGDKYGFAHRSFWSTLLGRSAIKETELEWNDFEEDLHVATQDPRAAREILTPDFMFDLHHWWLEHRLNVRISFIAGHMYILLPAQSIRIAGSTTSTKERAIRRYAKTILRPIWRSLILIEDVPR